MRLIKPKFEILEQSPGLKGVESQIELAGRTCYHSQNRITEDSAKKFVDMMVKSGHGAMLEHGTIYLYFKYASPMTDRYYMYFTDLRMAFERNKYSKVNVVSPDNYMHHVYITTNYRVIIENKLEEALKYICEPTEYHEKRVTVRFTCDIGISREFNRHRVNSPAEQSTRYCNYSKDKFSNELSIIKPEEISLDDVNNVFDSWSSIYDRAEDHTFRTMCNYISDNQDDEFGIVETWLFANLASQWSYMKLLKLGWKPEQARRVLPLDLQTELVHTAFVSDWEHFFELRCDVHAHPQARELAIPLKEEFIKRNYIHGNK